MADPSRRRTEAGVVSRPWRREVAQQSGLRRSITARSEMVLDPRESMRVRARVWRDVDEQAGAMFDVYVDEHMAKVSAAQRRDILWRPIVSQPEKPVYRLDHTGRIVRAISLEALYSVQLAATMRMTFAGGTDPLLRMLGDGFFDPREMHKMHVGTEGNEPFLFAAGMAQKSRPPTYFALHFFSPDNACAFFVAPDDITFEMLEEAALRYDFLKHGIPVRNIDFYINVNGESVEDILQRLLARAIENTTQRVPLGMIEMHRINPDDLL